MTRKPPPSSSNASGEKDWQQETELVKPLKKGTKKLPPDIKPVQEKASRKAVSAKIDFFMQSLDVADSLSGIDQHVSRRVKRGHIRVDARLDLHGDTQKVAQERLLRFVESQFARGSRLLLVVTGKGRKEEDGTHKGILRACLPEWLNSPEIREKIAGYEPAQQKDGGSGAFYLYLRRHGRNR